MTNFSIKSLEQFSGIKAHTLRIWEQRHCILKPTRTMTNLRMYTLKDLKLLLEVSHLNKYGFKISQLICMDEDSRSEAIATLISDEQKQNYLVHQLIYATYSLQVHDFKNLMTESIEIWGFDDTIHNVLMPFLERVRMMEQRKFSPEEILVKSIINQTFVAAIEQVKEKDFNKKRVLLVQFQKFNHQFVLHYVNYTLKSNGCEVFFLEDVSAEHLGFFIKELLPHFTLSYIPWGNIHTINEYSKVVNQTTISPLVIVTATKKIPDMALNNKVSYVHYQEIEKKILPKSAEVFALN